ncbi:hypothetical protein ACFWIA_22320 [Streptomyces sp. NPDC127068]|uniref:hypothetical protein n=1 Tax=Streptomyces sp. NPDC127068 TaxID=3347127 RepID=UPI0036672F31
MNKDAAARNDRQAPARPGPVGAEDVTTAVRLSVDALAAAVDRDWSVRAASLDWDCWETTEHLADDLFAYAVQLGPRTPPLDTELPFLFTRSRPGAPALAVRADRAAGPAGLLQVLEASGALLAAVVHTRAPETRAHHGFGVSDPEGFAAMGVVEILVHTRDIADGLGGVDWEPPADLCTRVLARLFPDVTVDADPWRTLLWATGRAELPDRARRTSWRWHGEPGTGVVTRP